REAPDGLLIPFCRVDPHDNPLPEAERSLENGARGIKLHPRAEQFTLDHPNVRPLIALAHERSLPVLIHAGRGIPALGLHAVQLRWPLQLGLSPDQIRSIASGQSLRIAAGQPLEPLGAAIGERDRAPHVLLDRVAFFLLFSALGTMRGVDPTEMLALARLAC